MFLTGELKVQIRVSVSGYPRIGKQRELKKWTESYFKGAMTEESLSKTPKN